MMQDHAMTMDVPSDAPPADMQPRRKEWPGFWPGIVVNDIDPELRGRLQVRYPQVLGDPAVGDGEITDAELPWAEPCQQVTAALAGGFMVPAIGARVLIGFVGGDPTNPVWFGGWHPEGTVPPEAAGSYAPGPRTYLLKTPNGHTFEMRYVPGEERVSLKTATGVELNLLDAPGVGGIKFEGKTPGGRCIELDDQLQKVILKDATQTIELDGILQATNITTPGAVNVTAGGAAAITAAGISQTSLGGAPMTTVGTGTLTETFTGAVTKTLLGLFSMVVTLTLTLVSTGLMSLTGAGLVLATTGAAVTIGSIAGAKQAVVLENFLTLYNAHTHTETGGVTTPPIVPAVPGTHSSVNTVVD